MVPRILPRPDRARREKWSEFMAWVDQHGDSRWVFRGLGDSSFQLLPGIGRREDYSETLERTILEIFERRASEFVDERNLTDWDKLALAQHHGLPTRLLDWTTNPLIGTYFAVVSEPGARELSHGSDNNEDSKITAKPELSHVTARLIAWSVPAATVVNSKVEQDPFELEELKFLLPRALSTRIVAQNGLFSVHPIPQNAWLEPQAEVKNIFDIPGNMREYFRRKLFYFGIDAQRVMGGLDGLCARLTWQYTARIGVGAVR